MNALNHLEENETLSPRSSPDALVSKASKGAICALALILTLTTVAYGPVIFNFFVGDDFVHLTWLTQAVKNPELIWRNFHSSWLDGTTTKFYRPLISIFMVTDYLTWHLNGLGFHLTNLAFHLISTASIYLIAARLTKFFQADSARNITFPLFAALIFGLYPLHPEAVSWITGRVDAIVTAFFLLSLWCYIKWRDNGRSAWCIGAAASMMLGLLSKEMAIVLPAAFAAYEILLKNPPGLSIARALTSLKPTLIFWGVLAAYFGMRYLALGTFVGGYDDSLFFISNMRDFLYGWLHGLKMLLVPVNKELLGSHSPQTRVWEASLVFILLSALVNIAGSKRLFLVFAFISAWLAFSLLPVYKIFAIADDLQGSRLAYLATVPVSFLMALAFTTGVETAKKLKFTRLFDRARLAGGVVFIAACFSILWVNNQAWREAGIEANEIRHSLDKLYAKTPGDPQVLFVGLPDQRKGAYICRNALWGMTKSPQLKRDISNCVMVDKFEPILPFGYLKQSLESSGDKVRIFRWDQNTRAFSPITLKSEIAGEKLWRGNSLSRLIEVADKEGIASHEFDKDQSLIVTTDTKRARRPAIKINLSVPCFTTDFILISGKQMEPVRDVSGLDLLYRNAINTDFNLHHRAHFDLRPDQKDFTAVFSLRSAPEWALGGKGTGFELYLPRQARLKIDSIKIESPNKLMPEISFINSGYLGTKGFLHLDMKKRAEKISYSAEAMAGAKGVVLEITRPNLLFASQNTQEKSRVLMSELKGKGTRGSITLTRDMFPALGIYEARAWAIDDNGNRIGIAGDHIVISVDS